MFLAADFFKPYIVEARMLPQFRSDHCPILLKIDYAKFKRGKGLWRFDDSLLRDKEYICRVKQGFRETFAKYLKHETYVNFFQECTQAELNSFCKNDPEELQNLEYNINPNLLLDMIINDTKNVTISYAVNKKKSENLEEKELFNKLMKAKNSLEGASEREKNEFLELEQSYCTLMDNKAKEKILTWNKKFRTDGEKPTRHFCNMEKYTATQ